MGRQRRIMREGGGMVLTLQEIERERQRALDTSIHRIELELQRALRVQVESTEVQLAIHVANELLGPHRITIKQAICCLRHAQQQKRLCPHTPPLNELQDRMQSAVKAFESSVVNEAVDTSAERVRLAGGDKLEWGSVRTDALLALTRLHADLLIVALSLNLLEQSDLVIERVGLCKYLTSALPN